MKKLLSFGAMAGVGALLVSTSLPANAFQSASVEDVAKPAVVEKQSVTVQTTAAENTVSRDSYTVVKPPPPKPKVVSVAAVVGSYANNPNGTIQWPFPSSPILSPYGPRGGSFHYGIDFFPGEGTPIGAIADGVVTFAGSGSGGWGNFVTVEHNINGQSVQSLYAHMQWGSIGVAAGQQVSVGQFLGAVGDTGRAYGAHLHLEIKVNGSNVDPYAWLMANAN
ncbi:MAG TPA: M23 family metallopeptidase [Homoserinimonas sp.]|nr:M23 family metallopeptidase [Homoserinimonas sp.]